MPKTSFGPKDSPSYDNATWFSTLAQDHPMLMTDREFKIYSHIDRIRNRFEEQIEALTKRVRELEKR